MMSNIMQDIRYALRQLRRTPGFTATVVLTLALGIGANTAFFTLVHSILLQNLPVKDPKALVRVGDNSRSCCILTLATIGQDINLYSTEAYEHIRDNTPEFQQLAAFQAGGAGTMAVRRVSDDGSSHADFGIFVSGNYFQTLGVQAAAGRVLTPNDDKAGAAAVAVMSYQVWQREYNSDPSVVGSSFMVNAQSVTVVGIAPKNFYGERMTEQVPDLYVPLSQEPTLGLYHVHDMNGIGWLYLIGRVKPGVDLAALQNKISGLIQQSFSQIPAFQTAHGKLQLAKLHTVITPGGMGIQNMQQDAATGLYLLMGIAGMVLLIACANIANLVLVRSVSRRQETSIRIALGATRGTIIRQRMVESMVLALLGGFAGLAIAYEGTKLLLLVMAPHSSMIPIHAAPSLPVLGFTLGVSVLTGLIFGTVPAWMTSHEEPANAMRSSSRTIHDGTSLLQRGLVVTQAALSLVLLVGAGLLGKSLNNMEHQKFGVETANRVIVNINPQEAGYKPEQLQNLYQTMEDRFRALPGVKGFGLAIYTPMEGNDWSNFVYVQGQPVPDEGKENNSDMDHVSAGYFSAIGQRVVRGREFLQSDTANAPGVAVVNQAFVKRLFKPGEDPIGQHVGGSVKAAGDYEIVGVVEDSKYFNNGKASKIGPMYFTPLLQQSKSDPPKGIDAGLYAETMVLQVQAITPGLEEQVRKTMASIDPNMTMERYRTFTQQINGNFNAERMITQLTLLFGFLALVLASVGLYGVTAYSVAQRTSEIGIRMALGAERTNVVGMVLRGAMIQTGIGLAIGIPAAGLMVQMAKAQLYEVQVWDVTAYAVAVVILSLAALVAGVIPARRAASIEPMSALRTE